MSKVELKVDWATHEAAKYACLNWHYSKTMPMPPVVKIGAWERGVFVGVVLFSRGASPYLGNKYNLESTAVCELTRVALSKHESFVTQILAKAIKFLKSNNPGLRLIVSFADANEGHHGGIYQAGNWVYSGTTNKKADYIGPDGKRYRDRQVTGLGVVMQFGKMTKTYTTDQCKKIMLEPKHRYLMPLDKKMRKQILPLSQPYPKRSKQAMDATSVTEMGQHQSDRSTEASHA